MTTQVRDGAKKGGIVTHRVSWALAYGEIPEGMHVLHKCDVRRCVNIRHLFLGTNQDNIDDKIKKGRCRPAQGEASGNAKLIETEVLEIRDRYSRGNITYRELAEAFDISLSVIAHVVRRDAWKHI